ncbi:MAG TPA: amidohydrolase family protein [Pyrinomonadaceae bacterium]|jgi:imidazolonepropionase-like amidohydrolase
MFFARRFVAHLILFSFLLACSASSQSQNAQQNPIPERVAIRAARMLDAAEGKLINNAVVVVENDKIVSAGSDTAIPPDAKIIDLGDATILPGLIDAHTHITYHFDENGRFGETGDASAQVTLKYAEENARLTLEAGFTTIRNLGDSTGVDVYLRDEIKRGETTGPRMIVSGYPMLSSILSGAKKQEERVERIRQFVKDRIAEKVDVIKIFEGVDAFGNPLFSAKEIRAAVEEARKANLKVAVHAHEAAAVIAAVTGGCDSIEHGSFLTDEAIRLLAKKRVALVPTLYLPTHYLEHKKQFAFDASTWDFFEKLKANNLENARKAKVRGVWIVNGSDAVAGYHGNNAREIEWLTKAGLKPAEAIRAATIDAAELLGLKGQIGEIRPGFFADVIAVSGNPLDDTSSLERVAFVMKSGKVIKSKL